MDFLLVNTPPLDIYGQMAFDELAAQTAGGGFALRVYNWRGAGVTFGYAQFYSEVAATVPPGTPLTRRPTGGGIVPHGEDMTFSCVFEHGGRAPNAIYSWLHGAFHDALSSAGIRCSLSAPDGRPAAQAYAPSVGGRANACFKNPVPLDIMDIGGKKILGGAIRKFERAALYQGSLQCRGARARQAQLGAEFSAALCRLLGAQFSTAQAASEEMERAEKLGRAQYADKAWIEKF